MEREPSNIQGKVGGNNVEYEFEGFKMWLCAHGGERKKKAFQRSEK